MRKLMLIAILAAGACAEPSAKRTDTVYVGAPAPDTIRVIEMRKTLTGNWVDADTTLYIGVVR